MKAHYPKRTSKASAALASAVALTVSFGNLTAAYADDYDTVCSGTNMTSGQKGSYCAAAKQSLDASKKDKTMSLVYGAVAGTCAASCAGWITTAYICTGASLGAAAVDMVVTKNFTSAIMGAASAGINFLMNDSTAPAAASASGASNTIQGTGDVSMVNAPTSQGGEGLGNATGSQTSQSGMSKVACWVTAASAAMSAVTHGMSASSEQKTAQTNLDEAKNYTDTSGTGALPVGDPSLVTSPSTTTTTASTASTATSGGSGSGSAGAPSPTNCGDTSTTSGAVSCAATADPQVASLVSTPDFQKAFQKSSGMSLDDYLKNGGSLSGSDAIKAAAGAAMGGDGAAKLTKAIAAIEQAQPNFNAEAAASYVAGGHGSGSGSGDADFNSMMGGLMDKLMPKSADQKKLGVNEVKFSGATRNLASVTPEDSTVSLFERVAYRYSHVTPRLLSDPAKSTLSEWSGTSPAPASAIKRN